MQVIERMVRLQMGLFEGMKVLRVGPIKFHFIAQLALSRMNTLIFGVFPERVPLYKNRQKQLLAYSDEKDLIKQGSQIWGYSQRQVLVLLGVVKSST